ncbi:MAG: hypothetical protein ACKVOR_05445 [Flavobacteriales bacterium]
MNSENDTHPIGLLSDEVLKQASERTPDEIADWLLEFHQFKRDFQTLEDMKNEMKGKGNKYGDYTEAAIEETYKLKHSKK